MVQRRTSTSTIGKHVDGLTAMMFVVVTFVSLMVHIYSTGYMHGDVRFTHFFAALSLFTAVDAVHGPGRQPPPAA